MGCQRRGGYSSQDILARGVDHPPTTAADPRAKARIFAANMREITARTADVQSVIESAAPTDPEMAQLSRSRPRPRQESVSSVRSRGVVASLVAWFGGTWRGVMRMTDDLGGNCEPGAGFMGAAAS